LSLPEAGLQRTKSGDVEDEHLKHFFELSSWIDTFNLSQKEMFDPVVRVFLNRAKSRHSRMLL
jgi:hypothetical protein